MNFFDMCYELFMRTSKYHDLGKDVLNYNKVINYMNNFYGVCVLFFCVYVCACKI